MNDKNTEDLREIFQQLRCINDRLARIETTQTLVHDDLKVRVRQLEDRPARMLGAAATVSAIISGIGTALVWIIVRVHKTA